ncbi:acetolactate synthase large subunit [Halopelagius longus]|uniref:Acetolactate synthase large subunit n=1 Tax=Halopelagius longus TaxID=1236180 RepID=A0A1H1G665_9EURY|nr:acetolactate synthase large subunit [Halopelagius longus]RDI69816.1 acetolactate synthase large subunit [Halopelagius longus]SDR08752.1 acetolactate synthase, large subunit [Halopelagius longus]
MKASDLFVECLEREGVEHVFGIPGEETEDLLFSLRDSDVTFVPVRHEQGAAFMADVHGRLTGEAGVCLSTLGPGATNLLTGVADAHRDKSPLVAVTAQGGLERLHKESHQALNVVRIYESVTKWNTQLDDPGIIHESVRKAFKVAEYEKPGATHLELPEDVAAEETDARPLPVREDVRFAAPDADTLDRVKELLREADRPLIIAGNGAVRTHAASQLRELVRVTDLPVASTYMGKGAVSDADEHSLMTLDSGADGEAASAIEQSDLVLTVGYDIAEHDPAKWGRSDTPVVHVDTEPAEVYEAYNPAVEVVADIGRTLEELAEWCGAGELGFDPDWYADLRERIVEDVTVEPAESAPFTVRGVLPLLREAMDPEDVLVSDVGSHKMAIAQNFPTYEPNTCIVSNGLASMGISVPGGVAADLATDGNVVAATGDGGFLMNAAEIETATRIGCEFTIVVFVDDDYGLISEKQRDHTGESFGTGLGNPDLVPFAESFGIDGYRPQSRAELEAAIEEAVGGDMSLIAVDVE